MMKLPMRTRSNVWLALLMTGACGRIGFDPIGTGSSGDGDASTGARPASCATLASTCGASGSGDCCESPLVPGGMFFRSYDLGTDGQNTSMSNPATVSSFRLDKYEITVGRFRAFIAAGFGTQANPPASGAGARTALPSGWDQAWNASLPADTAALITQVNCDVSFQTWSNTPGADEDRPMNCMSWYEAMAFCIWDGGYLPTEAEWNYAATGGTEQRAYPWSMPASSITINGTLTSYSPDGGTSCVGDGMNACTRDDQMPVGSKPAGDGLWGQSDMSGNLLEWTVDWYRAGYVNPCIDCADLTPNTNKVVRGGCYDLGPLILRAAYRVSLTPPTAVVRRVGARCARPI